MTSSSAGSGKTYRFKPEIVREQIDSLEKDRRYLRDILEGQYDDFADADMLAEEADKIKKTIATRKATIDAYGQSQMYRDLVNAEDPTEIIEAETKTASGSKPIVEKKSPVTIAPKAKNEAGGVKSMLESIFDEPVSEDMVKKVQKALNPGQAKMKAGKSIKGLGGGLIQGLAQAPALEFLAPPSAGPAEGTPEYDFEMGRISMAEFKKRLKAEGR